MRKLAWVVVVTLGALSGVVAVMYGHHGVMLHAIVTNRDSACSVGGTIRDYYALLASSHGATRYKIINGRPSVNPGDVVLDCGAWIGDTAHEALEMGAALVIAVEPSDFAVAHLKRNLAGPIVSNKVVLRQVALLDRKGWMNLYENPELHQVDGLFRKVGPGHPVLVTTIDAIVEELHLKRIDYIKMDIEGSEQGALRGAAETIRRFRPRLAVASYHLEDDYKQIPLIVKGIRTDYRIKRARCLVTGYGRVIPNLLYFY